jgi:hypothetical protein
MAKTTTMKKEKGGGERGEHTTTRSITPYVN